MNDKLSNAMDYIDDSKIAAAAAAKRTRKPVFFRAIAAVLALVVFLNLPIFSVPASASEIATASQYREIPLPDQGSYDTFEEFRAAMDGYEAAMGQRQRDALCAYAQLKPFFIKSGSAYAGSSTENRVWSPINAYIALAMLSEVTEGDSRKQIMEALAVSDLDTLRTQVSAVWEELYTNREGNEICTLANSLWLNKGLTFNQQTMDSLAYHHYASVFQQDLSSEEGMEALQAWLSNNTGGLLDDQLGNIHLPQETVLALASTVYLKAKWGDEFQSSMNTTSPFHTPAGDVSATFMNKKEMQTHYYWGDDFGAVSLWLKNDCKMWFLLPDEDKTVQDILSYGQYLDILTPGNGEPENAKYMKVNLSVPKFDVFSSADLSGILQQMGITDVFDFNKSDFSAIAGDVPVTVTQINQAARVVIDEQGVEAGSYIEISGAGAARPPEEIIDFILDRPFVFVIADSQTGLPLFTGVVNKP